MIKNNINNLKNKKIKVVLINSKSYIGIRLDFINNLIIFNENNSDDQLLINSLQTISRDKTLNIYKIILKIIFKQYVYILFNMCGIFAVINKGSISDENIHKSYEKIKERGPDSHILSAINNKVTMGFHRLSIMDISDDGNQPFIYKDSDNYIALICNGEIYNYRELSEENSFNLKSSSDCEIILHLYLKYGIETTVDLLDGVFAFIIYDIKKNIVLVSKRYYWSPSLILRVRWDSDLFFF